MKKQLIAIAASAALVLSLASCGKDAEPVKIGLPEGQEYYTLAIGDEVTIDARFPEDESITWSCKDDDIAVISPDGRLSGRANGITVVTARTASGYDHVGVVVGNGVNGSTAVSAIQTEGGVPTFNGNSRITNISLSLNGETEDETLYLSRGDGGTLRVNVIPSDCNDPITFTSSNSSILEVDSNGTVTPRSRGTVTVTATAPNGINDTFKIFVR